MYKKICINMLTQKDELAVAKTHHDIESLNLRPFSTIDEQSSHIMISNRPNISVPIYKQMKIPTLPI